MSVRRSTARLLVFILVLIAFSLAGAGDALALPTVGSPPWVLIMSEGFEGTFPSGLWTLYDDNPPPEYYWGVGTYGHLSSNGAWPAASGDPWNPYSGTYPDYTASRMVYGPFDLTDAAGAVLDFYYDHDSPVGEDYFCWQASISGTDVSYFNGNGYCVSGTSGAWIHQQFDLTSVPNLGDLTGQANVWVQLRFNSNGTNNGYNGPWVDDIKLYVYPSETLVINEIDPGVEDRVEIYNAGSLAVDMTTMNIKFYDEYGFSGDYTFPSFTLGAGNYVTLHDGTGTDTSTDLYVGSAIDWSYGEEGAVELIAFAGGGIDFVRWGSSSVPAPPGTTWTGSNPSVIPTLRTLGRDPNGDDTDDGSDWCLQHASTGSANTGCAYEGTILINEIDVGGGFANTDAAIELYNASPSAVNISGWQLIAYAGVSTDYFYNLPAFTLAADSSVVLHEGSGTDTSTDLYTGYASNWDIYTDGGAALTNGLSGKDFVRFGASTQSPPSGTSWTGTNPPIPIMNKTIGRRIDSTDTDDGSDWCLMNPNLGGPSQGCYQSPADFDADAESEVVVFRSGAWRFFNYSTATFDHGVWTGSSAGCIPAPMDYDGDGGVEPTQLCSGSWHFYNDDGTYNKGIWTGGVVGDLPVPADYDGDGDDDVVVWRGGAWRFFDFDTGSFNYGVWTGAPAHWLGGTSMPIPMDYDGDGKAEFTVWSGGPWHFYHNNGAYNKGIWTGGVAGDLPVPGNYDGEGAEEVVVWRGGAWRFFDFGTAAFDHGVWTGAPAHWLGGTPLPSPLDVDGDGALDYTVWSGGPWHFYDSGGVYVKGIWTGGVAGDLPLSRRLLP